MGALIGAHLVAGGHVKAPRLDAFVPIAPGEGQVLHTLLQGARAYKIGGGVSALSFTRRCAWRDAAQRGDALCIGGATGDFFATAVGHPHCRVGHRLALVQRGHPGQRVLAAQLEVDAQVGHQRRGAHVHCPPVAVALVQQRRAQFLRGNFNHMEAWRERNAHHLKRAWVIGCRLGQVQRFDVGLAGQQRQHAGLNIVFVAVIE